MLYRGSTGIVFHSGTSPVARVQCDFMWRLLACGSRQPIGLAVQRNVSPVCAILRIRRAYWRRRGGCIGGLVVAGLLVALEVGQKGSRLGFFGLPFLLLLTHPLLMLMLPPS